VKVRLPKWLVEEDILRHQQPVTGLANADAQVVIIEEPQAEALVEAAHLVEHVAAGQQAEAGQPLHRERLAGVLAAPPGRERRQPVQAGVVRGDLQRRPAGVGDRADHPDLRPVVQRPGGQAVQPAGADHHVVVEEGDVVAAGPGQPHVAAGREAHVGPVADHFDSGGTGVRRGVRQAVCGGRVALTLRVTSPPHAEREG
jgi:hypothetical protein